MSTTPILSKAMTISFAGKVVARASDFSLEINKETVDITTLDSAGWKEKLVDLKEWNISFNGLVTRGADASFSVFDELLTSILGSDDAVEIIVTDSHASGTITLTGNAFLTSLPIAVTVGDKVTYSGKLDGTGALVSS